MTTLVELVETLSRDVDPTDVVLLHRAKQAGKPLLRRLLDVAPSVRRIPFDEDDCDAHVELVARSRPAVVVDLAGGVRAARRSLDWAYHLRPGGWLVVTRPADDTETATLLRGLEGSSDGTSLGDWAVTLAEHVTEVRAGADHVAYRMGPTVDHVHAKVSELQVPALRAASYLADPLATRPADRVVSKVEVHGSDPDRAAAIQRTFEAPTLELRAHEDALVTRNSGVFDERVVHPDTFRGQWEGRLKCAAIDDVAPRFAVPADRRAPEPLSGEWLHLDTEWRGHFGHALVDQVTKLWALPHVPADAGALVFTRDRWPVADWEYRLWEAAGVSRDRVHPADGPVRVERLLTATPARAYPDVIHPALAEVYHRMGDALDVSGTRDAWPERVFFSRRRSSSRWCHNSEVVEDLMTRRGFTVVYPEEHPIDEQVTLIRRCEIFGGFTGSGLYSMAFAGAPKHVVCVGSESYAAYVDHQLAALVGHHSISYAWCRADIGIEQPKSRAKFKSPFTFDADREGRWIEKRLTELGC